MTSLIDIATIWAFIIAFAVFVYVVMDGFDLGLGMLFPLFPDKPDRDVIMNSVAPVWDGNETWLVLGGGGLMAAFPLAYAVLMPALYTPMIAMLIGLIFRGVAFEFRGRAKGMLAVWDWGFFLGSTLVGFVQGAAVGALMRGIPVVDGQFAGHALDWVHPFPVLTGAGMVLGYALLGAGWLVFKGEGALRDWAYARIPWLAGAVLLVLILAFTVSVTFDAGAIAQSNLRARSWGLIFPIAGVVALLGVVAAARARRDGLPVALTTLLFVAAYLTLGVMFWPYMIPYTITVADAASPDASLQFLFYCGIIVLPVIVVYTFGVYRVFRGKAHQRLR
jgi:cytochrome bd ubiquinol oxidase subunit II